MTEYQLYYFDCRGLGEPIRYILKLKNIPFTDIRIPINSIPAVIPADIQRFCRFGQVPVLKIDDEYLCQSQAIARFLGKSFDLCGNNVFESARCDELAAGSMDLWTLWFQSFTAEGEAKKAEMRKIAIDRGRERYTSSFNEILASKKWADGQPLYLVGNRLTWADIFVAHCIDNIQKCFQADLVSDFPILGEFLKTVFNTPGIKEYIASRPETAF